MGIGIVVVCCGSAGVDVARDTDVWSYAELLGGVGSARDAGACSFGCG